MFSSSKNGILCTVCGSNPIPANMLLQHYTTVKHKKYVAIFEKNKNINLEPLVSVQSKSFRYDITKMFMSTSVPLNKVNNWRPVLEKYSGCSLTDRSHLCKTYIPMIYKGEKDNVRDFARGKLWSMIF